MKHFKPILISIAVFAFGFYITINFAGEFSEGRDYYYHLIYFSILYLSAIITVFSCLIINIIKDKEKEK